MSSSIFPKLELKYCERCGGLWFRPQGGQAVYCDRCAEAIKELPPVKSRRPLIAFADILPALLPIACTAADFIAGGVCA